MKAEDCTVTICRDFIKKQLKNASFYYTIKKNYNVNM